MRRSAGYSPLGGVPILAEVTPVEPTTLGVRMGKPAGTVSDTGGVPAAGHDAPEAERRQNQVLRSLVGEMLERVRQLSRRRNLWSPEERAQAEAELEMIMAHVRREAAQSHERESD